MFKNILPFNYYQNFFKNVSVPKFINVLIIGESHNYMHRQDYDDLISNYKPDLLIHEAPTTNGKIYNKSDIIKCLHNRITVLLNDCGNDTIKYDVKNLTLQDKKELDQPYSCIKNIDDYVFELALKYKLPLIGGGFKGYANGKDLKHYYNMEQFICNKIIEMNKKYKRILLIMGSMHTRWLKTGGNYIKFILQTKRIINPDYKIFKEYFNYLGNDPTKYDEMYKTGIGNDGIPIIWNTINKQTNCFQYMTKFSYKEFYDYQKWIIKQNLLKN